MISLVAFLLFLGLIVFGPRKTIEFAQEIGRLLAQLKRAAGQLQESSMASEQAQPPSADRKPVT
jgi:Sec-independent protein translocase protein TatA